MAKYIYRRPPYPEYDIEGIESWLEDLAAKGLMLDKDGYVFGFMQFQRREPKKLKYRLEAIPKRNPFGFKDAKDPDEKALTLYSEFGWEYLGQFFDFYIYRSLAENAVELNTDPAIQSMTLGNVKRRSAYVFWGITAIAVLACCAILFEGRIISSIINESWLPLTFFAAYLVTAPLTFLIGYLHIVNLQKKLERGEPLSRNKNWRKGRFLRRLWIALPLLLLLSMNFANAYTVDPIVDNALDPAAYQEPLPFVTMAEMAPNREYVPDAEKRLSVWYNPLSPQNIFWAESASLEDPNEVRWFGGMEIYYHETANEWIAEKLIEDYLQVQANYKAYDPVPISAEEYGFDFLEIYQTYYGAFLYIRDGNIVIKAFSYVHTWDENDHLYPLWLELLAEKMA